LAYIGKKGIGKSNGDLLSLLLILLWGRKHYPTQNNRRNDMPTHGVTVSPTTKSIASYVKKNAGHVKKIQRHKYQRTESVREADYKGHHIVIRTQYEIEVDGKMVMGHMGVTNDGQVHYHPVPNLSFASAVDLVKQLINIFPDDFAARGNRNMHRKMKRTKSGHKHS
jgi:hypothetical protein